MSDESLVEAVDEAEEGVLVDAMGIGLCDVCANERTETCTAERFSGFCIECWFSINSGLVAGAMNSRGRTIGSDMPFEIVDTNASADATFLGGTSSSYEGVEHGG